MRTELWDQFSALAGGPPRTLATVTSHNPDGTSSVTTFEGAQTRVTGQLGQPVPYNVWLVAGRIESAAPNLQVVSLTV